MTPCRLTDGIQPRPRIPFGRLATFLAGVLVAGVTSHATAADVSTSPGRAAFFETRHLADVLMYAVPIDGQIAKGRSRKVLTIDASAKSFIVSGPTQVNLGLQAQVNGVTLPVVFSTNCAIGNACSTVGQWIVDLDQAEAANPGVFVGRPLDVHVTATDGFNRTATSLDLAMTAHMESKR